MADTVHHVLIQRGMQEHTLGAHHFQMAVSLQPGNAMVHALASTTSLTARL